jgi:hypothetical protein
MPTASTTMIGCSSGVGSSNVANWLSSRAIGMKTLVLRGHAPMNQIAGTFEVDRGHVVADADDESR